MHKIFTPWIVLPLALAAMAGLMYAAVVADSIRLCEEANAEVDAVDTERVTLEQRYFELVKRRTPQTTEAFSAAKRDFRAVIDRFRAEVAANPTAATPEEKRFRDDIAGVINRWEVVDREHQREQAEFNAYFQSFRGKLAQRHSQRWALWGC